jgi:methyl-accepting chemotaxis protein
VAEEVRSLAHRSAEAARETAVKIENSNQRSEHGIRLSEKVANNFNEITQRTRKLDTMIQEIADAAKQQSQGIETINAEITRIDHITQSNSASAEETASSSAELQSQADRLREAVEELGRMVHTAHEQPAEAAAATGAAAPKARAKSPVTAAKAPTPSAAPSKPAARPMARVATSAREEKGRGEKPGKGASSDSFFRDL